MVDQVLRLSFVAASALLGLAACGRSPAAPATTTAAEVSSSEASSEASSDSSEAFPQAARGVASVDPPPAGELACRLNTGARTYEYFLEWKGGSASGTLRITSDGIVETQIINAGRYKDTVFVDRPGSTDLVSHLATIRERAGKKLIKADGSDWTECR
jgi:hypothetical protein